MENVSDTFLLLSPKEVLGIIGRRGRKTVLMHLMRVSTTLTLGSIIYHVEPDSCDEIGVASAAEAPARIARGR
jgi:ABC-type phosphonate transport system ATPase subunit